LRRKDDHFPNFVRYAVAVFFRDEEAAQAFRREILCDAAGENPALRFVDGIGVEIGRKNPQ